NWKNSQLKLISATTAFGMGLNVNDICAVIHTIFPMFIDALVQETGHASRDEMVAKNVIIYSSSDIRTLLLIISQGRPSNKKTCSETNSSVNVMQWYEYLQKKQNSIFEIVAYCESVYECHQQQAYQNDACWYNIETETRQIVKIVNQVVSQQLLFGPSWPYIKLDDILDIFMGDHSKTRESKIFVRAIDITWSNSIQDRIEKIVNTYWYRKCGDYFYEKEKESS
ncbi:38088_t:CDS:2, partial [Gigaspora margarita]